MRTCIITGANSGIGKCAAFQLAEKGMRVILACRNIAQAENVCIQIRKKHRSSEVFARRVDLSSGSDTVRFIRDFTREFGVLDVLINNAADFDISRNKPQFTDEGNEVQFATNLLAPFMLTQELLPLLRQSDDGRILNISSQGLVMYPNLTFDFENIRAENKYNPAKTYYQTKLGLLMLSLYLREILADSRVSLYAVRVTNVKVDMTRYPNISPILKLMYRVKSLFSIPPEKMAGVYTALAIGEKRGGFLYNEEMQEVPCNKNAYDKAAQEKLWRLCEGFAIADG